MHSHTPNTTTRQAMAELESGRGERLSSIWDALEDTPEDAQIMRLRSTLLQEVTKRQEQWKCLDVGVAQCLGITLPELECLRQGKIQHFPLERLVMMCVRAGLKIELSITDT